MRKKLFLLLSLLQFALTAGSASTQSVENRSRITSSIDETSRVILRGNVSPEAQPRFDTGPAPASTRAERLMLILKRSPQQESDLVQFLDDVQNPSSARFLQFLTPEEFGRRFGISDSDLTALQNWLRGRGFSVAGANKGRTALEFSGTVGQIEETFQTQIHRFNIAGEEHLANTADPQIPAALAAVIAGVANLNDFKPRPQMVKGPIGKWNSALGRFTPDLTVTISGAQYLFLGPGDAATIYNTPTSINTRLASGQTTYDGTGVTIGIAGTTPLYDSGEFFYRTLFGLSNSGATAVYDGDQSNLDSNADETEALADVEISGALAPNATQIYYAAGDTIFQPGLFLAIYRAIDDNKINILNVSYGACEAALGTAGNQQTLNAWEQAAAQGITVVVSSGDSGSAGCDNPNFVTAAAHGFGVNGLASTPYNIAVGGTDFDTLSKNFSTYVGTNSATFESALKYIPEYPWNDSTVSNGSLSANTPLKILGQTGIWAGGGGASSAGNEGTAGYPKPAWQKGFSPSNNDSVRDVPDLSFFAGGGGYHAVWALCEGSDCSGGASSSIHGVGGTSTSAPAFAGILALVNQKIGASIRLGQANWVLYRLAQSTPSLFHQVSTGNNSVYCSAGSPNCGSNRFMSGYNAGSSYNLATGLGSLDATALVNHWADHSLTSTTSTLSLDKTTFTHGTPVTISASVNPSAATGNIAIENNALQTQGAGISPISFPLIAGSASGTFNLFPGGTYNVYASYAGDGTYAGSISQPVAVTVSPEDSILQLNVQTLNSSSQLVSVAGTTVPLGSFIAITAQPIGVSQSGSATPVSNATGPILFTDANPSYNFPSLVMLDSTGTAETNTASFPAGAHTVGASYNGDSSYHASTAAPITFAVAKAPTTISVIPSAPTTIGSEITLTAQIVTPVPANSYFGYGQVTYTNTTNNTFLGTSYASDSSCTGIATLCMTSYFTVESTQLVAGNNLIAATYAGDNNFEGSGPSAAATVNCQASCWNAAGQRLELSFGQTSGGSIVAGGTITSVVDVWQAGGFTGAVNLTCSVSGTKTGDQHIPTCSLNPTQVTITSTQGGESTLTLSTTASTASNVAPPVMRRLSGFGETALCSILLLLLPNRRYACRYFIVIVALAVCLGSLTACGGGGGTQTGTGGGGGGGGNGTTADVYTVTFRAADAATGTVTAQDYFNFTVN